MNYISLEITSNMFMFYSELARLQHEYSALKSNLYPNKDLSTVFFGYRLFYLDDNIIVSAIRGYGYSCSSCYTDKEG